MAQKMKRAVLSASIAALMAGAPIAAHAADDCFNKTAEAALVGRDLRS